MSISWKLTLHTVTQVGISSYFIPGEPESQRDHDLLIHSVIIISKPGLGLYILVSIW